MLHFLNQMLFSFRDCFARTATFQWFVVVIAGFISRSDKLGVTNEAIHRFFNLQCITIGILQMISLKFN